MRTYLTRGTARNPDSIRPAPTAWERTHPAGSAERNLYDASVEALSNTAWSGPLMIGGGMLATVLGRVRPQLANGGRGLRAAAEGVRDGVFVERAAAERLGRPEDLKALRVFDEVTGKTPWKSMTPAQRRELAAVTGWQNLPTGETVKQLPKFDFRADAWRPYERFTGRMRSFLSENAGYSVPRGSRNLVEMVEGPGARDLFEYYPELKGVRVDVRGLRDLAAEGRIRLSEETLRGGAAETTDALHHETLHQVQNAAGMDSGSTPELAGRMMRDLQNRTGTFAKADDNYVRAARATMHSSLDSDPAYFRYIHDAGEAEAFAVGRTATHGPEAVLTDAMRREGINPDFVYNKGDYAMQRDDKGGDDRFANGRNFLATDRVPDTIFGIPVAHGEGQWTAEDRAFFAKHPEAGGYYSMGDEDETGEQGAFMGGVAETLRRRVGEAGEVADAGIAWMERQTDVGVSRLFSHLMLSEGLRLKAYEDPGDHRPAIGFGAHEIDGRPVVYGQTITERQALAALEKDVDKRVVRLRNTFGKTWDRMDEGSRLALIDVSFGKDNNLEDRKGGSPGLHRDLRAAGDDAGKIRAAVMKHYPSYRLSDDPKTLEGLQNRRIMGMKSFFGEDFSYDNKVWDPVRGFVEAKK